MSQRIPQKPKRRRLDYRQDPCRDVFTCRVCGWPVGPQAAGTQHRNHCPNCLASVHLDDEPGDRAADCGGTMEPVAVWVRKGGEWAIIHRCKICGVLHSNRVAADDNPMLLMSLAVKPLAAPPFPLDRLERAVDAPVLTTHASLTARPFFERRGYRVLREQQVERHGVRMTNFVMEKRREA